MLALRRARGPLGRAFGAVTQALDWSTPQADAPGSQAAGYRGTPQDRTGPHVDCFQSIPVRVVMGKASDGAAETSEEVPTEEEVTKAGTGVESQQSAHSAHSGSSANTPRDQEDAEMGEDDFQIVLLAAAMKHVVCSSALPGCFFSAQTFCGCAFLRVYMYEVLAGDALRAPTKIKHKH